MGSYHSRQIADLVLLLSEYKFFNYNLFSNNKPLIFSRYIDDGFLLTNFDNYNNFVNNLSSSYPKQIPITFSSNIHSTHYIDYLY